MVVELSRDEARRIAVRAQLLAGAAPEDPVDVVRHLTQVQVDVTTIVAPSADLVMRARLGDDYTPGELERLREEGALVELQMRLRPAEDIALYRAEMDAWPGTHELKDWERGLQRWIEANDACREDILQRLRSEGPLPPSELPDTCAVPWRSSGWTEGKNVGRLLNLMAQRGEVAVSSREGNGGKDALWDLAERVYPDVPGLPLPEALEERARRRLVAAGIERVSRKDGYGEQQGVGDHGEPAVVEGVRGKWRVAPAYLEDLAVPPDDRVTLLSPLDRLVFERKRTEEVLGFEYLLEMYKPKDKRRWGVWAMPVLHGDRLVGKVDATADRERGVLELHAIHEDEPLDPSARERVEAEVASLAGWLDLHVEDQR